MPASFQHLDSELDRRFKDYVSLERWCKFELDLDLRQITPEAGLEEVRLKLLQRAEADGLWNALEAKLWGHGSSSVIKELVNRAPQWRKFDEAYHNGLRDNPGKPQIYVLPCIHADDPYAFVKRVTNFLVNQVDRSPSHAVLHAPFIAPSDVGTIDDISTDYKSTLFRELHVSSQNTRERSATQLLASHLRINDHIVVEMGVPVDDFGPGLTIDFLEWLAAYWDVLAEPKCLIFVHLQCKDSDKESWNKKLESPSKPFFRVLPPFQPVAHIHVKYWLQQYPEIEDPELEATAILSAGTRMKDVLRSIVQWDIVRKKRNTPA